MAQNNKTVHVIELRGELGSLEKSLSTLRQDLSGLKLPKGIDDSFGKLDKVIQTLQHRVADDLISPEEFKNVEKEVQQVIKQFGALAGSLTSLQNLTRGQKLALLPDDAQARLKGVTDALASYGGTLSTIIKLENERAAAQSRADTAKARVEAAQTNDKAARDEVARIQTQIKKYGELAEAIKEQEAAERAYAEAQKELEKAKRSGAGEKAIKNREEKLSKASREMEGARLVVSLTKEGMEPEQIREYEKAIEELSTATKKQKVASAELEDALKAQTTVQGALATVQTQLEQATVGGTENAKKQKEAYDSLVAAIKKIRPGFEDVAQEGETTADKMERLRQIVDDLSDDELEKLKPALEGAGEGAKEAQKGVDALGVSLDKAKEETKEFNEETEKVKALKDRIKQFLGIAGAVEVFRRAARDAISTITELDKTMTEMAVVTDLTVGDYWNQLPEYSKQASDLGVSINSAYKAATLYYQQGLKGNEVTKISTETLKMAKIAGLDTADATDKMTAALRGFNMELNETSAQKIADVYSELAAITAADVSEISSAMTKTASIASSAGMEFETTAAFLSQIIETTRESAETAGTAMKTVIARFQELKKAPEDIGEVDGEIVDANAIETALRSVGVSLRNASGQFRELDDVFLELSSKWDGLDKNTQRYIATIAAGSRQQSRFIAMMQNYGRTQELVTAANNSAGASQRQFQKTAESLESKVERLKNSWHEFTMGIMNSEFVKFGVDVLNTFMEIINKATNAFDGLGGSLTKIASVLAIFQMGKKIFQKLTPVIDKAMLGIVKKFYGYGEGAAKEFKKGVEGEGAGKTPKENTPTLSEEEKKKREKKRQELQQAWSDQATRKKLEEELKKKREERDALAEVPELQGDLDDEIAALETQLEGLPKKTLKKAIKTSVIGDSIRKRQLESKKKKLSSGEVDPSGEAGFTEASEIDRELAEIEQRKKTRKESLGQVLGSIGHTALSYVGGEQFSAAHSARKAAGAAREQAMEALMREDLTAQEAEDLTRLKEQQSERASFLQEREDYRKGQDRYFELRKKGDLTEEEKREKEEIAKRLKASKERLFSKEGEKKAKQYKEDEERLEQLEEKKEKFAKKEEDYNKSAEEYLTKQEEMWNNVSAGISKAGETITGVGVATSILGGIFEELGLTELGETISTIGQYITMVGGAITALGPIITTVGKVGTGMAAKLTAAGWSTQAAWWWVALIAIAVMALIAGAIALINHIKNNTPEAKLEKLKEQTEAAKRAAEEAAEEYNNLNDSIQGLKNSQDVFKNLTKGTKEWKEALAENNLQLLEMLEKYPELARFVKRNEDGVLTIDTESEGYQKYLESKFNTMTAFSQTANLLQAEERRQEVAVDNRKSDHLNAMKSILTNWQGSLLSPSGGEVAGPTTVELFGSKYMADSISQDTEKAAKAIYDAMSEKIASGEFNTEMDATERDKVYQEVAKDIELGEQGWQLIKLAIENVNDEVINELNNYGTALKNESETLSASMQLFADNVITINNTLSEQQKENAYLLAESSVMVDKYKSLRDQAQTTLDGMDRISGNLTDGSKEALVKKYLGNDYTYKDGSIKQLSTGEVVQDSVDEDYFKSLIAQKSLSQWLINSAESFDFTVNDLGSKLGADTKVLYTAIRGNLEDLTQAELAAISNLDAASKTFENQTVQTFGNVNKFVEGIKEDATEALTEFTEIDTEDWRTVGQIKQEETKLNEYKNFSTEFTGDFYGLINELFGELDVSQTDKQEALDLILQTNLRSKEELEKMFYELEKEYGVQKEKVKDTFFTLYDDASSATLLEIKAMGELYRASQQLAVSMERASNAAREYERSLKDGKFEKEIGNSLAQSYLDQGKDAISLYKQQQNAFVLAYAQGGDESKYETDLRDYVPLTEDGKIDYSNLSLDKAVERGEVTQEEADKYLEQIEKYQEGMSSAMDDIYSSVESLEELEKESEQARDNLIDMAVQTLEAQMQEQIDSQHEILEATRGVGEKITGKIQEQINKDKEERQINEAREGLSDSYSQLAYLNAITSGEGSLESQALSKATKESEKELQDLYIEQQLQSLEDANEKAIEQRERQITLLEQQKEAQLSSREFLDELEAEITTLLSNGNLMTSNLGQDIYKHFTSKLSTKDANAWKVEFENDAKLAGMEYSEFLTKLWEGEKIDGKEVGGFNALLKELKSWNPKILSDNKLLENQRSFLKAKGISVTSKNGQTVFSSGSTTVNSNEEEGNAVERMYGFVGKSSGDAVQALTSKINAYSEQLSGDPTGRQETYKIGDGILNEQEFYETHAAAIMSSSSGKITVKHNNVDYEVSSYEDYLSQIYGKADLSLGKTLFEYLGGIPVPIKQKYFGANETTGDNFDLTVNGQEDLYVALGPKVDGTKLQNIVNQWSNGNKHTVYADLGEGLKLYTRRTTDSPDWYEVVPENQNNASHVNLLKNLYSAAQSFANQNSGRRHFKTGGLADFTGPAWLDGTPSKPEYVLNAEQTERFFSLIDVLEHYKDGGNGTGKSGNSYFDININVEKLESDYDVEKVADKIRRMIAEDASYRNVNAINHIR